MPQLSRNRRSISRRTMLRGMVGGSTVALGLPLLEAMLDANGEAHADGAALPVRFISFYWADGIVIDQWEPSEVGPGFAFSPQLAPFAGPIQDYVSVISGYGNQYSGELLTHHEGMCGFSGHPILPGVGLNSDATGATIDQRIADAPGVADCTPIRSVNIRVSKRESADGDGGTTVTAMSHRDNDGTMIPQIPEANPVEVWQNLFGAFVPDADDGELRQSVLDFVKDDAAALRARLGVEDRARIDSHLQGIAELEAKITAVAPICTIPPVPTQTNDDVDGQEPISAVVDVMSELIAQAFLCDITRVASFLLKKFVSSTVFDEINANDQHHSSSHAGPNNSNYRAGITYQMEKFADLLQKLHSFQEPAGGTLLDNSIIYATSDCSTGAAHSIARQPMIVAGGGRGYLANPGVHVQGVPWNGSHDNPNSAGNMSDVLLTCLQAFEPTANSIGSGSMQSSSTVSALVR